MKGIKTIVATIKKILIPERPWKNPVFSFPEDLSSFFAWKDVFVSFLTFSTEYGFSSSLEFWNISISASLLTIVAYLSVEFLYKNSYNKLKEKHEIRCEKRFYYH